MWMLLRRVRAQIVLPGLAAPAIPPKPSTRFLPALRDALAFPLSRGAAWFKESDGRAAALVYVVLTLAMLQAVWLCAGVNQSTNSEPGPARLEQPIIDPYPLVSVPAMHDSDFSRWARIRPSDCSKRVMSIRLG